MIGIGPYDRRIMVRLNEELDGLITEAARTQRLSRAEAIRLLLSLINLELIEPKDPQTRESVRYWAAVAHNAANVAAYANGKLLILTNREAPGGQP